MTQKHLQRLLSFLFLLPCLSFSQTINGIIRDSKDNSILPFATIQILETKKQVLSDIDGKFQINHAHNPLTMRFSMIGYKTEEKTITDADSLLVIFLTPKEFYLQAVTIYSGNNTKEDIAQVSSLSLKSDVVKGLSKTFNDMFKSLQTLPGISVNNEMSAKFNVRGGNFDENLVLVNGTQVFEPFHLKKTSNVSVGIFNADLMQRVDLITGGFSSEYGDRMSSVLKIDYREGSKEERKGILSLSLTDFDLLLEGPITNKSTFIIGARKSYVDYLLGALNVSDRVHPSLYDVQGVVAYDISSRGKLLFQFIHSGDKYFVDSKFTPRNLYYSIPVNGQNESFNYYDGVFNENNGTNYTTMFNLQWRSFLSSSTFMKAEAMYYYQYDNEYSLDTLYERIDSWSALKYFSQYKREIRYENNNMIKTFEGKISANHQLTPFIDLKAGFSFTNLHYDQTLLDFDKRRYVSNISDYPNISDTTFNGSTSTNDDLEHYLKTTSFKCVGYAEGAFQYDNIIFTLGGRFDYFGMNKDLTFSPRVNFSYKTGECVLRFAYGHFYQSPLYNQFKYSYETADNTKSQKAVHYILGADIPVYENPNTGSSMGLKIETFYKKYESLISSKRTAWWRIYYSKENDADGHATGFDLQYNFTYKKLYGWISYGLLYSKEDKLNDGKPSYPRYTDQRHTLSIVMDFKMKYDWDLNFRAFYGSGYVYTPYVPQYNAASRSYTWIEGDINSSYLPSYFRVDSKISKKFMAWGSPSEIFLDIMNLFNTKNIMSYRYSYFSDGTPKKDAIELFPILPSLGLRIGF